MKIKQIVAVSSLLLIPTIYFINQTDNRHIAKKSNGGHDNKGIESFKKTVPSKFKRGIPDKFKNLDYPSFKKNLLASYNFDLTDKKLDVRVQKAFAKSLILSHPNDFIEKLHKNIKSPEALVYAIGLIYKLYDENLSFELADLYGGEIKFMLYSKVILMMTHEKPTMAYERAQQSSDLLNHPQLSRAIITGLADKDFHLLKSYADESPDGLFKRLSYGAWGLKGGDEDLGTTLVSASHIENESLRSMAVRGAFEGAVEKNPKAVLENYNHPKLEGAVLEEAVRKLTYLDREGTWETVASMGDIENATSARLGFIKAFSESSSYGAAEFALTEYNNGDTGLMLNSSIQQWLRKDSASALKFVEEKTSPELFDSLIADKVEIIDQQDLDYAKDVALKLYSPDARDQALKDLLPHYVREDPLKAFALVNDVSIKNRKHAIEDVALQLVDNNSHSGAEWIAGIEDRSARDTAILAVVPKMMSQKSKSVYKLIDYATSGMKDQIREQYGLEVK